MLNEFANREELIAYLREQFPQVAQRSDRHATNIVGGRKAAQKALQKLIPHPTPKHVTFSQAM